MKQQPLLEVDPFARRDEDFYGTPRWMTKALLRRLPVRPGWRVCEPCAGDGAILRALPAGLAVVTNDIVPRGALVPDFLLDATKRSAWDAFLRTGPIDLTITNPPFDEAIRDNAFSDDVEGIVPRALEASRVGVAMLLRITWLEPTDIRGPWLREHPPAKVIVLPRHNFRGTKSTDSATAAWVVWDVGNEWGGQWQPFDVVTKSERDDLIAQYGKAA